ncbi:unnamed protein product [Adineta ricciae]|uniref:Pentapeptide repeat-containing protein n=2 Tax=Adineta ricciae TaxID=249248 RepID=A0A815UXR4_ADIRI|nr:unnamed protein product [Adineta ricciae]
MQQYKVQSQKELYSDSEIDFSNPISPYSVSPILNQSQNKRSIIELIAKLVVGLIIAAFLAGIFIVLVVRLPTDSNNNNVASPQEQETSVNLLIKSNEHIAELQREHEVQLEKTRQFQIEVANKRNREAEQQYQWLMEQRRVSILDKNRREDQINQNEKDFYEFLDQTNLLNAPHSILQEKVLSLIRRFDPFHKTLLIKQLYQENLLNKSCISINGSKCLLSLIGADLSGIELGKKDQSDCIPTNYNSLIISGAKLMNASFDCLLLNNAILGVNLSNASFSHSLLHNTRLSFADLTKCNFRNARMNGGDLSMSTLPHAQFQRASLIETILLGVKSDWSDFSEAILAKSAFSDAQLANAKFDNANISEVQFDGAHLENVSFYKAYGIKETFWSAHLTNTNFQEAILLQSQFLAAKGNQTDFSNAILDKSNLQNIDLNEALFYNTSMNMVSLPYAKIINSNLHYASFIQANCDGAHFDGSDLSHAKIIHSYLRFASFIQADFFQANLTGSYLTQVNFTGSKNLNKEQLDAAFSISEAFLPDGTIGRNKNLVKYGHPMCNQSMNNSMWIISPQTQMIIMNQINRTNCAFQSRASDVTSMSQLVDINYYATRMMELSGNGMISILLELDLISGNITANLHLFNSTNHRVDESLRLFAGDMNKHLSAKHYVFNLAVDHVELDIFFHQMNTTIDNIHLSIEI